MTPDAPTTENANTHPWADGIRVRGARTHNLHNVDLDLPRDAIVAFTGVSGSGKSSLAFGTIFAEAQRRYLESVSPYARRLIDQAGIPDVDELEGMPPAVALQQARGGSSGRSDVATTTQLSSVVRMLFSRAGEYPPNQPMLYAEDFSPNTPEGACPECHGMGRVFDVPEELMVPDDSLTIRERAVASWPVAWAGQNQRDILVSRGIDVDIPWRKLPKKTRDWILYTEERPTEPVYAGLTPAQTRKARQQGREPSYRGTFVGARRYVLDTFANTKSEVMKRRVVQFVRGVLCPHCEGSRIKAEALRVTVVGHNIADFSALPLAELQQLATTLASGEVRHAAAHTSTFSDPAVTRKLANDLATRLEPMIALGLGYLSLDRAAPTLSGGERQRLRLATQLSSKLFGVAYVLDEPSAGLHPRDLDALVGILHGLRERGNSVLVVEHSLAVIAEADWLVDIGPGAGDQGGRVLYSGPPAGIADVEASVTRRYLTSSGRTARSSKHRQPQGHLTLTSVECNTIRGLDVTFPLGCLTAVTGVSGAGKSSLIGRALPELVRQQLGQAAPTEEPDATNEEAELLLGGNTVTVRGTATFERSQVKRVVVIDQKPIGRTPRSNVATYTGLFDSVRRLFAATPEAKRRKYTASRFSFNVAGGRCPRCEGEGAVMVELLFMPSIYSPCPECGGTRYEPNTLEITWREHSIADVLACSVDEAISLFGGQERILAALHALHDVGLGYVRLGQPATELSGGEAQRVKLATELQRSGRGTTLYILDEPTAGLHPADADRLMGHLHRLVADGGTVIMAELDMRLVAEADHVIDLGPGAGVEGGTVVAAGTPEDVARHPGSASAPYLAKALAGRGDVPARDSAGRD